MHGGEDIIATLSGRVSELSKRVAMLQAELDSATRRIALYEEHDSTIQDALSGALRAAYQIRERAETTAEQILEQAREERRMLLKEIERLREERDSLQDDIAAQRRSGISAVAARPLTSDTVASELRSVASEALKGLFQEIVDDMRRDVARATPPSAPPAQPPSTPPAAAQLPYETAPTPSRAVQEVMRAVEPPAPAPVAQAPVAKAPAAQAPAAQEDVEPARPTYQAMAQIRRAPLTEEEEVTAQAPAAPVAEVAPTAPPLEVVPSRQEFDEIAPPRVEAASPTSDIQLVLSPIASFPRLVEVERHIQALPVVRTLYVRDFRSGTATLAVALRSAMTPEEFAGMLASLTQPRMRLVSGSRNVLELRIEGEASIA